VAQQAQQAQAQPVPPPPAPPPPAPESALENTLFDREYSGLSQEQFEHQHQVVAAVFGLVNGHQARHSGSYTKAHAMVPAHTAQTALPTCLFCCPRSAAPVLLPPFYYDNSA
jgi:hypothetical protein